MDQSSSSEGGLRVGKRARFDAEVEERIAKSQALLSHRPSPSSPPVSDGGGLAPPLAPETPPLEPPLRVQVAGLEQRWQSVSPVVAPEVTPPHFGRERSTESLSVAQILGGAMPCDGLLPAEPMAPPRLGRSPSIVAAAAALLGIPASGGGPRRRLETMPSSETNSRSRAGAVGDAADGQQSSGLWLKTIGRRVSPLSSATTRQLAMLSAAFQLCPQPTKDQIVALSAHVCLTPRELETWLESRRALEEWVHQRGTKLGPATLARLFYAEASPEAHLEAGMAA